MFPGKPVRLIVPFGQLGAADVLARVIAGALMRRWKKPVLIANVPGAGSVTGTLLALRAQPDGHTLLLGTTTNTCIAPLMRAVPFDPQRDMRPLALIGFAPNVLTVHPSVPVMDVAGLRSYAESHPGALSFASAGAGQSLHVLGELFKSIAGIDLMHVPYDQGSALAYDDLLAGRVQLMFDSLIAAREPIRSGALRALALLSPRRNALFPDVPTLAEAGYAQLEAPIFYGVFASGATDAALATHCSQEIVAVLPTLHDELAALGVEPGGA